MLLSYRFPGLVYTVEEATLNSPCHEKQYIKTYIHTTITEVNNVQQCVLLSLLFTLGRLRGLLTPRDDQREPVGNFTKYEQANCLAVLLEWPIAL